MSYFKAEVATPSCLVTIKLIESLENYLADIGLKLEEELEECSIELYICITDSLGTEKLNSIKDFCLPRFSDGTKSVALTLRAHSKWREVSKINIELNKTKYRSSVVLEYDGSNSREFVAGRKDKIIDIIKTYKNNNYLLYGHPFVEGLLTGLAILAPGFTIAAFQIQKPIWYLGAGYITLFIVYVMAKFTRPYTIFDSRRSEKYDKIWNWFLFGLLGFIVFGVIMARFKDKLFVYIGQ